MLRYVVNLQLALLVTLTACGYSGPQPTDVDPARIEAAFAMGKADTMDMLCEHFGQLPGCDLCCYLQHNEPFWYNRAQYHGVCPFHSSCISVTDAMVVSLDGYWPDAGITLDSSSD